MRSRNAYSGWTYLAIRAFRRGKSLGDTRLRQCQRHLRSDIRNARRVGLHADGEVLRDAVVTQAAEPGQAVAHFVHDALVLARDPLAVLPSGERRNALGQARHLLRREHGPVAAVDEQRQAARLADRFVVIEQSALRRVDVVRAAAPGCNPRRLSPPCARCRRRSPRCSRFRQRRAFCRRSPSRLRAPPPTISSTVIEYSSPVPPAATIAQNGYCTMPATLRSSASRSSERSLRNGVIGKPNTPLNCSHVFYGHIAFS